MAAAVNASGKAKSEYADLDPEAVASLDWVALNSAPLWNAAKMLENGNVDTVPCR